MWRSSFFNPSIFKYFRKAGMLNILLINGESLISKGRAHVHVRIETFNGLSETFY